VQGFVGSPSDGMPGLVTKSRLKSEIHGLPIGFKTPRWAENKSGFNSSLNFLVRSIIDKFYRKITSKLSFDNVGKQ
jgi:hypothetical protein